MPLAKGGSDAVINTRALCVQCHDAETAREFPAWKRPGTSTLYVTGSTPNGVTAALDRWHSQDRVSLLVVRDDQAAAPAIAWAKGTKGVRLATVDVWHGLDLPCAWTAADEQARALHRPDRVLVAGSPEGTAATWDGVTARRCGGGR